MVSSRSGLKRKGSTVPIGTDSQGRSSQKRFKLTLCTPPSSLSGSDIAKIVAAAEAEDGEERVGEECGDGEKKGEDVTHVGGGIVASVAKLSREEEETIMRE